MESMDLGRPRVLSGSSLAGHHHHAEVCSLVSGGYDKSGLRLHIVQAHSPDEIVDRVNFDVNPIGLEMHGNGDLGIQVLKGLIDLIHVHCAVSADGHQNDVHGFQVIDDMSG